MSTSVSPGRLRNPLAGTALPRPRLTVVPRVTGRARTMPFLMLVVLVLGVGLVGLLLLNTSMERTTYQVTAMRQQADALAIQQQALELKVAALQDPQVIAQRAVRLGMVENPHPAFIELPSGRILGQPGVATSLDRPDIGTKVGPGVDQLAKVAPVVAGEASGIGSLVSHQGSRHAAHEGAAAGGQGDPKRGATKQADTGAASADSGH